MPWLVAWAAGGIMIVMVSATVFHLVRGEMSSAAITLVLLAMATFVAYAEIVSGRSAPGAPLERRRQTRPQAAMRRKSGGRFNPFPSPAGDQLEHRTVIRAQGR